MRWSCCVVSCVGTDRLHIHADETIYVLVNVSHMQIKLFQFCAK